MSSKKDKRQLREDVAKEFSIDPKQKSWKFSWRHIRLVDFENMTLKQARNLYKAGVPGLVRIKKKE